LKKFAQVKDPLDSDGPESASPEGRGPTFAAKRHLFKKDETRDAD